MAWYNANKNGGHKVFGRHEPAGYDQSGYPDHEHHPVILDADGRKHEIIGYAEYHNAQSYMTQTEQVVELRRGGGGGLGLTGHNLSPRGKDFYKHQGPANKPHLAPWKATTDWPESGRESSPKAHTEKANGGSPRYNTAGYNIKHNVNPVYGHNSPPPYSRPHSSSDDESDDEECYDGVCYPKPKVGAKPNTHFSDDGYDRKPKVQVHNYSAPHSYGVPILTQPGKDHYYGKPTKGNTTFSPPSYEAPHNRNRRFTGSPPPPDDYTARQPKFNGQPKGYPSTIDSSEAKKRYGGVTVPTEPQQYSGTIDARAAADKYQGVFVRGNNF